MPTTAAPATDTQRTAEERWRAFYEGLMNALRSEDMPAAVRQAEQVAAAVQDYLAAATTAEERAIRAHRLVQEIEAARRSAIATREFLREQAKTVKPTAAYAEQREGEHERWSRSL
ncbi:hypothetical protein [uncultured Paludibaculum sp.]|uniref:hypothetical protein n=1 Tax=uncultured Paludibaculum sp. TaxID=1765020 RepID=UPI002AAA830F|nr:hypothetical protein [uncultured Paludibaculum sp.]